MKEYLKIAATGETRSLVRKPWEAVALSENLNGAELACIIFMKGDERAKKTAEMLRKRSRLEIPVVEADTDSLERASAFAARKACEYERANVPGFLLDLVNFADEKRTTFATPGHHNGQFYSIHPAGEVFSKFFGEHMLYADTSDTVPELGDMLTHGGTPLDAERQAARAFNADKAYFCTNGTTSSNTICASACLTPGDLVLFDRNNHKSLYNSALVMTGARPVYLETDRNPLGLIGPLVADELTEEKIREKIAKVAPERAHEKRPFRLAVLQLETYDGVFYDARFLLDRIGGLCDYVLFDCAWGGYEQFIPSMRKLSPLQLELGPDDPGILVTQSVHKQQAGLAQTSQILKKDAHIKGQERYIDHKRFNNAYLKYVTTSYSYPVYASLTVNAAMAEAFGNSAFWQDTVDACSAFCRRMEDSSLFTTVRDVESFRRCSAEEAIQSPVKIVVKCPGINIESGEYEECGIPGPVVGKYLMEHGIVPEKSDLYSLLFLVTPGRPIEDLDVLYRTLMEFERLYLGDVPVEMALPRLYGMNRERYEGVTLHGLCDEMHSYYSSRQTWHLQRDLFIKKTFNDYEMLPYDADLAFMKNQGELVPLDDIVGRIALEGALPYPPGVFIVAPGERWQQLDVDYFRLLMGAMDEFPGFDPEIQGIYLEKDENGRYVAKGYVLKKRCEDQPLNKAVDKEGREQSAQAQSRRGTNLS